MTVVAMWCRHAKDDLIGIGERIPWNIPSDTKRFLDVVEGQNVVCGRVTYESFSGRTIEGCKIFVLTSDSEYEVSDPTAHCVISGQKIPADEEADIYIAGRASVYYLFMSGKEKLKPQIIVDCVYDGEIADLQGEKISISSSVSVMLKEYRRMSPFYVLDNVKSAVWVRKGDFVEQSVLKRIITILEKDAAIVWE